MTMTRKKKRTRVAKQNNFRSGVRVQRFRGERTPQMCSAQKTVWSSLILCSLSPNPYTPSIPLPYFASPLQYFVYFPRTVLWGLRGNVYDVVTFCGCPMDPIHPPLSFIVVSFATHFAHYFLRQCIGVRD